MLFYVLVLVARTCICIIACKSNNVLVLLRYNSSQYQYSVDAIHLNESVSKHLFPLPFCRGCLTMDFRILGKFIKLAKGCLVSQHGIMTTKCNICRHVDSWCPSLLLCCRSCCQATVDTIVVELCNCNYQPLDVLELDCEWMGKKALLLNHQPQSHFHSDAQLAPEEIEVVIPCGQCIFATEDQYEMFCWHVYAQSPIAQYNPGTSSTNLPNGT